MVVVYVVLAVAVAAAVYFLFLRPAAPARPQEQLPSVKPVEKRASDEEHAAAPVAEEPSLREGVTESALDHDVRQRRDEQASPSPDETAGKTSTAPSAAAVPDAVISLGPDRSASEPPDAIPAQKAMPSGAPSVAHVRNIESLRRGLEKSRAKEGFFGRLLSLFAGKKDIDPNITTQLEEVLLASDVGTKTTEVLLSRVREKLGRGELADADAVWSTLREEVHRVLSVTSRPGAFSLRGKPTVVILVGVNGVGKTTTIGKLATRLKAEGRQVILAAGDTFRAAAVQQLVVWGSRAGVEVVRGKDGADPGSVIFDAVQRAKQVGADVVLADTAGRLHTKSNLMAELKKVVKTTSKALDGAPHEILLVVDATNGQNAMAQAAEFQQAMPLTGVVLTKLDGTAKGGVVLGICDSLNLPVRFVGLGETANDLHDFVPEEFVEALLGRDD
jgi:fused signal recognition particle receptor